MNTNIRSTNSFIVRIITTLWLLLPTANCLVPTFSCKAQSDILKYAHQIVDTLSAPGMHGRGYVLKGDSIAADFLKKEFEKIGLKPVGLEFYQKFYFSINTFPENILVKTKNRTLISGKDFIAYAPSPPVKGKYPIEWIDKNTATDRKTRRQFVDGIEKSSHNNKALFIDTTGATKELSEDIYQLAFESYPAVAFRIAGNKLTNEVSTTLTHTPQIVIMKNVVSLNDEYIEISLSNKYIENYTSRNILGYIKGTQYTDSFIVFSAHYDHLGRMGKDIYFPGANDNASGCAMLLNLAKHYSQHPPEYSIVFMAFGAEEVGLLGSKHYVENPLFPLKQIKFLVNMDIMGTGEEGIKVVNATEHKKEFDALVKINEEKKLLPGIQPRGKAKNSDHYFFEEAGVKTFFIYTLGGIKAYHDIYDKPETLPLTEFEDILKLLTDFSEYLQK